MKMKNMRISSTGMILWVCFGGLLVLSACSGSAEPESLQSGNLQEVQTEETPPKQAPTEVIQVTNIPTEEILPTPTLDQAENGNAAEEAYPAPEDQESGYPAPVDGYPPPANEVPGYPSPDAGYPPPMKLALEATDPATVSLASGELQLVEFFAFW